MTDKPPKQRKNLRLLEKLIGGYIRDRKNIPDLGKLKIIPSHAEQNWWVQGFRSNTYRITVQIKKGEHEQYLLKEYGRSAACYKDFVTEAAVAYVNDHNQLDIFPKLLSSGYPPFESKRKLLFETLTEDSLEMRFAEADSVSLLTHEEVLNPQDRNPILPIAKLHEVLKRYEPEITDRMLKISGGKFSSIDDMLPEKYAKKFMSCLERLGYLEHISEHNKEDIEKMVVDLSVERLLSNSDLRTIIQYDGYPKHILATRIVDGGGLKFGSRITHLSCAFASPPFDNLSATDIKAIIMSYCDIVNRFRASNESRLPQEPLLRGFYFSGLMTNFALAGVEALHGDIEKSKRLENAGINSLVKSNHLYPSKQSLKLYEILEKARMSKEIKNGR